MGITKEQLEKYIEIQKNERGIQLTEKEAVEEVRSLLTFVQVALKTSYKQKNKYNNSNITINNGKINSIN